MVSEVAVSQRSRGWEYGCLIASVVAGVALVISYSQHQQVVQLSTQLAAANGQSDKLQRQVSVQAADLQRQSSVIQAEAKPDLPISVGFRSAFLGPPGALVMEIRNNSGAELEVAAIFSSNATGLTQQRDIALAPNVVTQLGSSQGWAFVPGQRIAFRNANFRPAEYVVPQK